MFARLSLCASLVAALVFTNPASAALIKNTGAKLSGTAKVTTNTKGQRQIALTIDPGAVTAFQLDVTYQPGFVTPAAFDGINPALTDEAVHFVPPYGGAVAGGASILPGVSGLISNIAGQYTQGFGPPVPNRPDGGNDLFTIYFIDN